MMAAAVLLALVSAGSAFAQAKQGKIKGKGDGNIRVNDADRAGVEDLGVANIEGRIYKPSVFYVLARGEVQYQGIEFRQDFTDKIVKGAKKRPF
jgi:hypothetical protein